MDKRVRMTSCARADVEKMNTNTSHVYGAMSLRNPHNCAPLRALDGRDERVQKWLRENDPVVTRNLVSMIVHDVNLDGATDVVVFCFGGRHRSVAVIEMAAAHLRESGWDVRVRHTALEGSDEQANGTEAD